jgi:hypothetical protein
MHGAHHTGWVMLQEIVRPGLRWITVNKLQRSVGLGCMGWRFWVSVIPTPKRHQSLQFGTVLGQSPTG